jgi:hypothetical protein
MGKSATFWLHICAALIFRRIARLCRASVHKDLRLGDLCKELGFSVRTRVIRDGALVGSDSELTGRWTAVASEMRPYQSDLGENALLKDENLPVLRARLSRSA